MQKNLCFKKSFLVVSVGLLFGMSMPLSVAHDVQSRVLPVKSIEGNTIYVDDDNTQGPWDGTLEHPFRFIQEGINYASDGDTIFVFTGTYFEHVAINKTIQLQGEDQNATIIDANGSGCPIVLIASGVKVTRFTLQNSGNVWYNDAGIQMKNWDYDTHNNTITENRIINNYDGIFMFYTNNNYIAHNTIVKNRDAGIFIQSGGENNTITENIIVNNTMEGVFCFNTDRNKISYNSISDNKNGGVCIWESEENDIFRNIIQNMPVGIAVFDRCWDNNIYENTVAQNQIGLSIDYAPNTLVSKNNFLDNDKQATFEYYLLGVILLGPLVHWVGNYWDRTINIGPMRIRGLTDIVIFYSPYDPPLIIGIPWINIDWLPAIKPYNYQDTASDLQ